ncbi:hypothetical protein EX30DRAFT_378434 [Ascodesmis nigricans]|uniref:C2H2-type domain-containing protein n=1 Tax=Ascodesmis nigricans TaxID=341454 RepID=A0A4V3SIL8_9PEZI|nr:hypothetical protein EX30DRAFT_378434 [Ascodesmis nigricans]
MKTFVTTPYRNPSLTTPAMTKKKKRQAPEIEELLARPWCYYCERDFDDLKILIHHQKAKHFKCDRCSRRLNTAGGLRVHMEQVHKETLEQVENALPGRESVDLEIFGTEGIPESEVAAHNQRIIAEHARKEADKRAASGQSNGPKRPKIDIAKELDPEEIKRKLQEHKRAMQSGSATPVTAGVSPAPDAQASPQVPPVGSTYNANSPPAGYPQSPYGAPPGQNYPPATYPPPATSPYPTTPYGQPHFQHPPPTGPAAQFGRGAPPQSGYGYQPPQQQAGFGAPPFPSPPGYAPHSGASLPQPHQIPGLPPKPNVPGLPARPAFSAPTAPGGFTSPPSAPGFSPVGPPPSASTAPAWNPPTGPSQGFGAASSSPSPGAFGASPPPPGAASYSNPAAPVRQQPGHGFQPPFPSAPLQPPPGYSPHPSVSPIPTAHSVRGTPSVAPRADVIPTAPMPVPAETLASSSAPPAKEAEAGAKKEAPAKPKREARLVYGDNTTTTSPEEKRAALPKYAAFKGLENIVAAA